MATLDSETGASSRAYLSIYAAFRLARILLDVKERLKSRIKARSLPAKPSTISRRDTLQDDVYEEITRALNVRSRSGTLVHPRCQRTQGQVEELELETLLQKLDSHANPSDDKISSIAAHDQRFLDYDPQRATAINDASMLSHILDLTTQLLDRLKASPGSHTWNHRKVNQSDCDHLKCEKFIANLEHLLRCLQQAIVEALIHNTLKLIDADILHCHSNWQQRRGDREGWFAEWPNGQPPLNTTWPWNVKPSLVVLWGVCWMFYDHNSQVNENNAWMTTHGASRQQQVRISEPVWTGHPQPPASALYSSLPEDQNIPGGWWDHDINSLLQLSGERVTTGSDSDSYAVSQDHARALGLNIQYSLPSSEYIFNNTLSEPSTLLPASSDTLWPYNLAGSSTPDTPYPNLGHWEAPLDKQEQQQQEPPQALTTPHQQGLDEIFISELPQQHQPKHQQQQKHRPPHLNNPTLQLEVPPQDMTAYLPSPHSDSGSTCISGYPVSPSLPANQPSSSVGSPQSRREGSARSMEPRNEEGLLYCTHQDCVNESRIFSRKCEWQKHMDKHNRPYVCEEPGCEKIQGFTYSGGLLRHQREVHRQHGGPKASCMCPHRDCKRSTGVGFSRKENLYEHLRRVHRGVGNERDPQQAAANAPVSASTLQRLGSDNGSRKRRRANDDEDDDEDEIEAVNESRDLRKQVKRLRKELQEKDERLRKLEQAVDRLTGGRLPVSSA